MQVLPVVLGPKLAGSGSTALRQGDKVVGAEAIGDFVIEQFANCGAKFGIISQIMNDVESESNRVVAIVHVIVGWAEGRCIGVAIR